jgi:acetyl-CoA C-acetyltransferase
MRVGVLGIGKTPHKIQHGKSLRDLVVEAGRGALADAGLEPADIQALYVGNVGSVGFNYENSTGLMSAHHLGVVPAGAVRVEAACGTGAWALHLGCVAILSGLYDTVMVLGAEKMNDLATVEGTSIIAQAADSKEEYFSGLTFPSGVALTARKYMQTYNLTEEDLAHTSVKNHHYGARNPYAHLRFECTVEEVMRSAKVADPLKLYEVCPMTDAGSALVLCREEILRDQPDKPQVYVTATQMATGTWYAASDTLADAHALLAAPAQRAYEMAGVSADDVDVAEIYNSFAIQEPLGVEALGFAEQGEGWKGAADGSTWIDGKVAVNLSGAPARPRRSTSSSSCAAPRPPTCSAPTPRSASRPAAAARGRWGRSTCTSAWRAARDRLGDRVLAPGAAQAAPLRDALRRLRHPAALVGAPPLLRLRRLRPERGGAGRRGRAHQLHGGLLPAARLPRPGALRGRPHHHGRGRADAGPGGRRRPRRRRGRHPGPVDPAAHEAGPRGRHLLLAEVRGRRRGRPGPGARRRLTGEVTSRTCRRRAAAPGR